MEKKTPIWVSMPRSNTARAASGTSQIAPQIAIVRSVSASGGAVVGSPVAGLPRPRSQPQSAAPAMISGKGRLNANRPRKASTAIR